MMTTIIIGIILLGFAVYIINEQKPRIIHFFPEEWKSILEDKVAFYQELDVAEKERFQQRMFQFLNQTYISGVKTEVEDVDKVLLAASAVIPVFAFPNFTYSNLKTVILFPSTFNKDLQFSIESKDKNIFGLVGTGRYENQMILSQKALRAGFAPTTLGRNTAIHEFVHLIDKMDNKMDGVPEILIQHAYSIPWLKLIQHEMRKIENNKSELRGYGATDEAEFFAVASEYFFEKPEKLEKEHPHLYRALAQFFQTEKTPPMS